MNTIGRCQELLLEIYSVCISKFYVSFFYVKLMHTDLSHLVPLFVVLFGDVAICLKCCEKKRKEKM